MCSSCCWPPVSCRRPGGSPAREAVEDRPGPPERQRGTIRALTSEEGTLSLEPAFHIAKNVALPPFKLWFNWRLEGLEQIPETGPVLIAGNHVSYIDPFAHGYFVVKRHRRPRFLGKAELFDVPVLGWALENARQIPVDRATPEDPTPLRRAEDALEAGECVIVDPEGTVTTNPDFLPMQGKTGTVRLSLATGVPITPVAVWGGQAVWQKSGKGSLKFARPIFVKAGPPIDVSAHRDEAADGRVLRKLTDEFMGELTRLVEELRAAYPKRWAQR